MAHAAVRQVIHATTIAVDGRGLVILGASGSGKSALALQMIALGADLVADDRTELTFVSNRIVANAPDAIKGRIEARGVALLTLPYAPDIPIYLAVNLDNDEPERLPYPHAALICGQSVPCLHRYDGPHFPASMLLYLRNMVPHRDE